MLIKSASNFFPSGEIRSLEGFRAVQPHEDIFCCATVGRDSQSGTLYCGQQASRARESEQGYVALCATHVRRGDTRAQEYIDNH